MKTKWDWSTADWHDYYDRLRKKADDNYQNSGDSRYDRERYRYEVIVEAFDKAVEYNDERDNAKMRRMRNIDAYMERLVPKGEYSRAEVMRLVDDIKDM